MHADLRPVTFLESTLDIEIDDEDLVPDNFATIDDVTKLAAAGSRLVDQSAAVSACCIATVVAAVLFPV